MSTDQKGVQITRWGDALACITICAYPLLGLDGGIPSGDELAGIYTANPDGGSDEAHPDGECSGTTPTTSAALMPNLLLGGPATTAAKGTGTHIGDGLPPIPAKLAAKIRRGEFVDMYELLPEFWTELKE